MRWYSLSLLSFGLLGCPTPGEVENKETGEETSNETGEETDLLTTFIDFADAFPPTDAPNVDELVMAIEGTSPSYPGLTFTTEAGFGLIGGEAYGDLGNWNNANTENNLVPDPAWGLWEGTNTIRWDSPVDNVSFRLETEGMGCMLAIETTLNSELVDTEEAVQSVEWVNVTLEGPLNEVTLNGCFGYVLDNLEFVVI